MDWINKLYLGILAIALVVVLIELVYDIDAMYASTIILTNLAWYLAALYKSNPRKGR